jgi:hypothetical protein
MAIRRINRPLRGENGLATGTIVSMGIQRFEKEVKVGRDTRTDEFESFVLEAAVPGVTGEDMIVRLYAGLRLNDEPVEEPKPRAKPRYNMLTQLVLTLGGATIEEIANFSDDDADQCLRDLEEKVVGRLIRGKINQVTKSSGKKFWEFEVGTLELLPVE